MNAAVQHVEKKRKTKLDEILIELRRALMAAADKARAKILITDIERALIERNGQRLLTPEIWGEIEVTLGRAYAAAIRRVLGASAAAELKRIGFGLRFDLDNPYSLLYIQARTGTLVSGVLAESKAAIRAMVERGFIEGIPPREMARTIRDSIGLTPRLSEAVANREKQLLAAGMDADKAAAVTSRYADQLLAYRADTIARTETLDAMNQGTVDAWREAQQAGLLDPMTMGKTWIATPSARTCPICSKLDAQVVGLNQPFRSPDIGAIERPPAHPACRCTTGLVELGATA